MTVKNGKGKKIEFVDAKGVSRIIIDDAQIFTNSSSAKVTLSSGIEFVDAFERTKAITLTGNSKANTLLDGSGNDSLYGSSGKDRFIYKPGEGTDTILDYQSGDMLQILKSNG